MAHSDVTRTSLRAKYIHDRLPLEQAAVLAGVPAGTAARWKRQAREAGDDWDKLRAASSLAGEGVESLTQQMLADYLTQHKTLMESIASEALSPMIKVDMLASLADSFNKTIAACRRVLPETNELAIALEVVSLLGDFIKEAFPQHAPVFLEILEPFGALLPQHFSKRGK